MKLIAAIIATACLMSGPTQAKPTPAASARTAIIPTPKAKPVPVYVDAKDVPFPAATLIDAFDVELWDARFYLLRTASPGATMARQGVFLSILRLHPEFTKRLSRAIREARGTICQPYTRHRGRAGRSFAVAATGCLAHVGVSSAFRPPAYGVGGFKDKFNSMHAVGLAVDLAGLDGHGTRASETFRKIALRHGLYRPYDKAVEYNHYQATLVRVTTPELRASITAKGPIALVAMFAAGTKILDRGPPVRIVMLAMARNRHHRHYRTRLAAVVHHHRRYARHWRHRHYARA